MSDYHNRIMNLQTGRSMPECGEARLAFKQGHRDARHTAAEIAAEAEDKIADLHRQIEQAQARVVELERVLEMMWEREQDGIGLSGDEIDDIEAALSQRLRTEAAEIDKRRV